MVYKTISYLEHSYVAQLVEQALAEDAAHDDISAKLIAPAQTTEATIFTREQMVVCGQEFVHEVYLQLDKTIDIRWRCRDGDNISAGEQLCTLNGNTRSLLAGERCALNFLQLLSATATLTAKYVEIIKDTQVKLLDTRKTIPGYRLAQKYAVYCGGGNNHRVHLADAFLIKENHIESCGCLLTAIEQAKLLYPEKIIEVEVENFAELTLALGSAADIIMLDNFSLKDLQRAVSQVNHRKKLEASGNVNLHNIKDIAQTGVDYISVGALTKNIQAIDLTMRFNAKT